MYHPSDEYIKLPFPRFWLKILHCLYTRCDQIVLGLIHFEAFPWTQILFSLSFYLTESDLESKKHMVTLDCFCMTVFREDSASIDSKCSALAGHGPAHTSQVAMTAATECGFEVLPHPRFLLIWPLMTCICSQN